MMRFLLVLTVSGACAGCSGVSDATAHVFQRLESRNEGQTKIFAAPARTTYEATRVAAGQMGYRVVRGGAAQGELDAVSGVGQGDANRSSRQLAMKVRLRATEAGGGTEVNIRLTEILEADSTNRAGLATETPLRDTPQYQVFFRAVQQALDAEKSGTSAPKP